MFEILLVVPEEPVYQDGAATKIPVHIPIVMIVMIACGCSKRKQLTRVAREIIARVAKGGAYDSLSPNRQECVEVHSGTQDHAGYAQREHISKDELYGMRIFCTDRNRLHKGMVKLVNMLIDESRVQKTMGESEDHVLSNNTEVELPDIGPSCWQIFYFEAMSNFEIIN